MKRVLIALILVLAVQVSWGSALGLPAGRTTTTTNINFPGIIDNKPMRFHVFGADVLPVEPTTSPNAIGGLSGSGAASASLTAAVARLYYASIGDTLGNSADGSYATVGGGYFNRAIGDYATVGGGRANYASGGDYATVGGGGGNGASKRAATIGGGYRNEASGAYATIGGGYDNEASRNCATVGGGYENYATGSRATASGGYKNKASGDYDTVGGGRSNTANASYATVGGGRSNTANANYDTVGGGYDNEAAGGNATVGGGRSNTANGWQATIGGGSSNTASAYYATVGGGYSNEAKSYCATVGGGSSNHATVSMATVGGGYDNEAGGGSATVPGGRGNSAMGSYSFAAGRRARAHDQGAFVWADSSNFDFDSTATDEFSVRCTGGARFVTDIDGSGNPTAGVELVQGDNAWSTLSDRDAKTNFSPVDARDILKRLTWIPIETWNYKSQDPAIRHMGPMAQDFYAAFGLGEDDKHISTIDPDGVALAAIQGLYELVQEKDAQIADLKARVEALEALVSSSAQGQ